MRVSKLLDQTTLVPFSSIKNNECYRINDQWYDQFIFKRLSQNYSQNIDVECPVDVHYIKPDDLVQRVKEEEFILGDKDRLKRYLDYKMSSPKASSKS